MISDGSMEIQNGIESNRKYVLWMQIKMDL